MVRSFYWKLFFLLVIGMITFFGAVNYLIINTEEEMSFIDEHHQNTLKHYALKAEQLYIAGEIAELNAWLSRIEKTENTWAAVIDSNIQNLAGSELPSEYLDGFVMGRGVDWKIHLYFTHTPTMGFRFKNNNTHFLIALPEHMRPGKYWILASIFLYIVLPAIILLLIVQQLYKHIMQPLKRLQKSTEQFAQGQFNVRVSPLLGKRDDEFSHLARTFDDMAERTQNLIETQRLLIADLSHEMRTPIARMELALEAQSHGDETALERTKNDLADLKKLAQDALTLAWLETEKPALNEEALDLVDLIECLLESARFEFPEHRVLASLPEEACITNSNHRALGQAIENVIRNALKYTPIGKKVIVMLSQSGEVYTLLVEDEGPGVPEGLLEKIFTPFFRVDKSRGEAAGGFGLGLSLAKRQIEAVRGSIFARNILAAKNNAIAGLRIEITLPTNGG